MKALGGSNANLAQRLDSFLARISTRSPPNVALTAVKAALRGLVNGLAMELAHHGVHVNSQFPGYMIRTRIQTNQLELVRTLEKERFFRRIVCLKTAEKSHFVPMQQGWAVVYRTGYI